MPSEPLHPDEALRLVLESTPRGAEETVPLAEALGRAMARDALCLVDQPPFDKSAMDGFAFAGPAGKAENGAAYRVVGATAAGEGASRRVSPGECVRIMTGAPLPPGADSVQRVEWTQDSGTGPDGTPLVRFLKAESVSNVIKRGENLLAGAPLLGTRFLGPQDLGILASSGYSTVAVSRRPLVGVVSTGDEIVAAGSTLGPASIFDSNGPQLAAQARAAGGESRFYGAFPDEEEALRSVLSRALAECDVVVVSGGVSMGDFDFVPRVLEGLGVAVGFHGVRMRPGKPTFFGMKGRSSAFGLPGNPVSTFVNFDFFVRPHIAARQGIAWNPRPLRARLAEELLRRGSDRVEFLPARLEPSPEGLSVRPLKYHGSSMLAVLAQADALLRMEIGVEKMESGEVVDVRLIRA